MVYGYYLEGYGNGIFFRHCLEGYKSRRAVIKAARLFKEQNKVAETGFVLFSFTGSEYKYRRSEYQVLVRFNAKAFFEFWG